MAQEHYWTELHSDLGQAIAELSLGLAEKLSPGSGAKSSQKLAHDDDFKGLALSLNASEAEGPGTGYALEILAFVAFCLSLAGDDFTIKVGPEGLEPPTKGLCLPPRLSPPLSGSWSGLSLLFTSSPYSLYTFLRRRLGSGLAYLKRLSFPRI